LKERGNRKFSETPELSNVTELMEEENRESLKNRSTVHGLLSQLAVSH